jgi:hypothetical protein
LLVVVEVIMVMMLSEPSEASVMTRSKVSGEKRLKQWRGTVQRRRKERGEEEWS